MTIALLAALAILVAALAALAFRSRAPKAPVALRLVPPLPTGHRVLSGPRVHNRHGFLTTALVDCVDHSCHCRKGLK